MKYTERHHSRMNRVFARSVFSVSEHPRDQARCSIKYSEGEWFIFRLDETGSSVVKGLKRVAA